ncbi:MAG: xylulokinase [Oscillospiraceae bacterium]|nr:xylulokinase [Oscillospiraceae bacterium]
MAEYLLGIDIGTSACKTAVFDQTGKVIAQTAAEYPLATPQPGWAEQNADQWWEATAKALRQLWVDISPAQIAAVGIDGQGWSPVLLDAHGDVLCPTPLWLDTRATEICNRLRKEEAAHFALCGNPIQPGYLTPKLAWVRENMPEVYKQARCVLQSNSFIAYRLTGAQYEDFSMAYGYHCFDMRRARWDEAACEVLGVDKKLLPALARCDSIIGKVTPEAARVTGLPEGTPVAAGGLDAACATFGAGVVAPGQTQEQGGQAGGLSVCIGEYKADPRLILGLHVVPNCWLLQGGTTGGGGVMRWMTAQFGDGQSFAALDALAATVPPASEGVTFLPYMNGERSPIWNPSAKGVFYGLDFGKTRAHLFRAALEGAAYALRHNLEVAEAAGASVTEFHAVGGAANSRLWMQIKADVTGKPLHVPSADTAATLGAAMLAGVGVGMYPSCAAAAQATVRRGAGYTPDSEHKAAYDAGYQTYLALYAHLKTMMGDSE